MSSASGDFSPRKTRSSVRKPVETTKLTDDKISKNSRKRKDESEDIGHQLKRPSPDSKLKNCKTKEQQKVVKSQKQKIDISEMKLKDTAAKNGLGKVGKTLKEKSEAEKKTLKIGKSGQKSDSTKTKMKASKIIKKNLKKTEIGMDEEDESDWEDVPMLDEDQPSTSGLQSMANGLQITVEAPKSKEGLCFETEIQRAVNRIRKQFREDLHKVHLLSFVAHLFRLSTLCNTNLVRSAGLSLIPSGFVDAATQLGCDLTVVTRFTKWFRSAFTLISDEANTYNEAHMLQCILNRRADLKTFVLLYVSLLRVLGLDARILFSCQPFKWKEEKDGEKTVEKQESSRKKKVNTDIRDWWVEIYFSDEERWICVDIAGDVPIDQPQKVEEKCTQFVHYVLAVDNEGSLKDVTARYSSRYLSPLIRRLRLGNDWWKSTLTKFRSVHRQRDRLEDMLIHSDLMSQPMPQTVSEYKSHPLFVLKRDLLKYEAIYPADSKPVGQFKNEPVYLRSSVHTLYSEQTWLKEARVIKKSEEAYNSVKRIQRGVPKDKMRDDIPPLPVYGYWQTEPYVAKPAINGKVPRNQFGNVDMFKPHMLPTGTVHLHLPGLLYVAKKLDIDCAPAMTGWDWRKAKSFPILDGWIVCEEHKETLMAAWEEEQRIKAISHRQKVHERALQNWKRLAKGLVLRHKMRKKFYINAKTSTSGENDDDDDGPVEDPNMAWPHNRAQFTL